jgi:hypothetical protein
MSADFDAIVALCRRSSSRELLDASLRLVVTNDPDVEQLVTAASSYRQPEFYIGGRQQHVALSAIPAGTNVELRFDGLTSNAKVIMPSLTHLLHYQQGLFLNAPPAEYFLLEEEYATGDAVVPEVVQAYQRVPKLINIIEVVADVILGEGTAHPTFVLLSGKRMDLTTNYSTEVLLRFPAIESIDSLSVELQSNPFTEAKKGLFKKVLMRVLEATPQQRRFAELAERFDAVRQAFAADFDLYTTEFNFEKVRESFEQKRLSFVLQLNSATSDLLNKLLAIPVGQGLIVSQLKSGNSSIVGNSALMLGSLVFAAFAVLLIVNQQQSLKQIRQEIEVESVALASRFPQLYGRLQEMFKVLRRRAWVHAFAFPTAVALLLLAMTIFSAYAFSQVPPGADWAKELHNFFATTSTSAEVAAAG